MSLFFWQRAAERGNAGAHKGFQFRFVSGEFVTGRQFAVDQQMRHFFKFAMFRQIKNIVAAVMQVIAAFTHGAERRIARRNARKCHRFFRFNDMGTVLQDRCVAHVVLVICRVEIFFVVFYFTWLRANRSSSFASYW